MFISLLFMLKNLFYKSFLDIQYMLRNEIKITILVNTYAILFYFINKWFEKNVCKKLETYLQYLTKLMRMKRFDGKITIPITHAIYLILFLENYTKSLVFLLILKLKQYFIIFVYLLINKYRVLLNIINNSSIFF